MSRFSEKGYFVKEHKKKVTLWKALENNWYLYKLAFLSCPGRVIGELIHIGCRYGRPLFYSVIFIGFIFQAIEEGKGFEPVVLFLIMAGLLFGGIELYLACFTRIISPVGNQKLYGNLHIRMYKKAMDVELECYENPKFYNQYAQPDCHGH